MAKKTFADFMAAINDRSIAYETRPPVNQSNVGRDEFNMGLPYPANADKYAEAIKEIDGKLRDVNGLIIRTAAEGKETDKLEEERNKLTKQLYSLRQEFESLTSKSAEKGPKDPPAVP